MVGDMDTQEDIERRTRAKWESLRQSYNEWAESTVEPFEEFDRIVEGQVRQATIRYQKERATEELNESSIAWDRVTPEIYASFLALLETDPHEPEVHQFLAYNPQILVQTLSGGHGRYHISKPRFGSELVPDFVIAEASSIGVEWNLVELESPRLKVERKDGLPTQNVNHAIGQIRDWRTWLMNNINYARRPNRQSGLGLVGIDPRAAGIIIIGRRQEHSERYNEFRRAMIDKERIVIHSYDWLLDVAQSNLSGRLATELPKQF